MKRLLSVALVMVFAVCTGRTQQAPSEDASPTKQDIEKLLVALHVRERTQAIMENSREQKKAVAADLLRKEAPEASKEEMSQLQGMIDEMVDGIYKDSPVDAILQDMVPIYQRHLTNSEVSALIAFYSSPVGQKVLREVPAITSEAMQVVNSHLQPRLEAALDKLKERAAQMAEADRKRKEPGPDSSNPKH